MCIRDRRAIDEMVTHDPRAAQKRAFRPQRFAAGAQHDRVLAPVDLRSQTAPPGTENAGGMRIVHQQHRTVSIGNPGQFGQRRARLADLIAYAEEALGPLGVTRSGSQIMPLVVGEDARTMALAQRLREAGFDIRGIRPPTVPAGTSRLRISLTLNIGKPQIDALATTLSEFLSLIHISEPTRPY